MNLLIFGATGGTGRQLLTQALAQGHTVTAFARQPSTLPPAQAGLRIVQGNVLDYQAVQQVLPGHDAVLSALGAPGNQKDAVRSLGTRHILQAMEEAGVRRFVCLTTLGMGDSKAALPWVYSYFLVPLFLRHAFADSEIQEDYIRQSQADWTIARPATLTDGPRTGRYQQGFAATAKGLRMKISRADVADFMLGQLHDPAHLRQAVSLSY
ncbi:NAD(P)-dependent oxidoreductase [Hymenobacter negativus]|uniref:SDR family oxidoreductase n=1 Tax=Hymenobacter negativus TaxID=2795026 RepID=A0ABS3QN88_9BACT|nr:SDR family oxidoreductase [Hymenobacter negativus]MBO2012751.1 SDR family oxidoreductase [Hymenobacter negativus]